MGFILWGIWKERNHQIFREEARNTNQIWKVILENIWETILVKPWTDEDWMATRNAGCILSKLNLKPQILAKSLWKFKPPRQNPSDIF